MAPTTTSTEVTRSSLRVGTQLAEGGEGRVFELPDLPGVLYKEYRRPVEAADLSALVSWARRGPGRASRPSLARVEAATAWPSAVVVDGADAVGLLMPRAPRRFTLRHRDGIARLASLSYLTADPVRRSAAYGLVLPAGGDPERIALVYALARVLEALEDADEPVVHGDLSAKNVLWSLQRGPQVFLLDCDNGERFGPDGTGRSSEGRRRAMTPNWDDPSVPGGADPGPATDRYSLGLVFLRIVGAAHFPVQKRQRAGEAVDVALDLPPAALRRPTLGADAPLWALVSRSLSAAEPEHRPPASTWAAALHDVLVDVGAAHLVDAVHAAQGSAEPSLPAAPIAGPPAPDVVVTPQPGRPRAAVLVQAAPSRVQPVAAGAPWGGPGVSAGRPAAAPGAPSTPVAAPVPAPLTAQARAGLLAAARVWLSLHRRALRVLRTSGRRRSGAARLVACGLLDFALACVALLLVAMAVSPFLGI